MAFYWGTAADGAIAFSDDAKLLKEGCGKSFAPFPQGNALSLTVSVMGDQILCWSSSALLFFLLLVV